MGLKRQRPACGNDDKRTGNQLSGLRWRIHENVVNRLNPVLAFDTIAVCPDGPSEQLRARLCGFIADGGKTRTSLAWPNRQRRASFPFGRNIVPV